MAKAVQKKNPVSQSVDFFQDAYGELKKVHVPSREETSRATMVVVVMIVIFSLFLGLADLLVGKVMQAVLNI